MSRVLRRAHHEVLVHTGQHYDDNMSSVFFRQLDIPEPDIHLGAGGGGHAEQTARMLTGIEEVLRDRAPDWVLIYGDTNSTLAAALAASKLHIAVAHVEAGLRSFNRRMPEEVNRVVADHLSSLLLCPSEVAATNLSREGIVAGVEIVGDVMADALLDTARRAESSDILTRHGLAQGRYVLATVHRAENTDDPQRLTAIFAALGEVNSPVLLPLHPRTRKFLALAGLELSDNVLTCEPLGYLDMVRAVRDARLVMTDSGGLQKEAYWLATPCVTLRDETEWVETVDAGWNTLAGADRPRIVCAANAARRPATHPALYGGDGQAAERVLVALERFAPGKR